MEVFGWLLVQVQLLQQQQLFFLMMELVGQLLQEQHLVPQVVLKEDVYFGVEINL